MKLSNLTSEFTDCQRQAKGDRTYETYGRKIFVFQEYLEMTFPDVLDNCLPCLHNLDIADILGGIRYYVDTYGIHYKSTTDSFLSSLSVFFSYVHVTHGVPNVLFDTNSKYQELRVAYEQLADEELKLNKKESVMPIDDITYNKLIAICDEKIDLPSVDEIINGANNGVYSNYISAIISKFTVMFGTKNKVISQIQITDYNEPLNQITINSITVRLPNRLAIQMKRYTHIRSLLVSNTPDEHRLFVDITPSPRFDNAKMYFILKSIIGTMKATALAKYAIINLLNKDVSSSLIMEFTGYSEPVCGHCQEIIAVSKGKLNAQEKSKMLDKALWQLDSFN